MYLSGNRHLLPKNIQYCNNVLNEAIIQNRIKIFFMFKIEGRVDCNSASGTMSPFLG